MFLEYVGDLFMHRVGQEDFDFYFFQIFRQCNVSRKPVNHCKKRHLNGESLKDESLKDKERSSRQPVVAIAKIASSKAKGKRGQSVHCGN